MISTVFLTILYSPCAFNANRLFTISTLLNFLYFSQRKEKELPNVNSNNNIVDVNNLSSGENRGNITAFINLPSSWYIQVPTNVSPNIDQLSNYSINLYSKPNELMNNVTYYFATNAVY